MADAAAAALPPWKSGSATNRMRTASAGVRPKAAKTVAHAPLKMTMGTWKSSAPAGPA